MTTKELTVVVSKVLSGNLEAGVRLTLSGEECSQAHLDEAETLLARVEEDGAQDEGAVLPD